MKDLSERFLEYKSTKKAEADRLTKRLEILMGKATFLERNYNQLNSISDEQNRLNILNNEPTGLKQDPVYNALRGAIDYMWSENTDSNIDNNSWQSNDAAIQFAREFIELLEERRIKKSEYSLFTNLTSEQLGDKLTFESRQFYDECLNLLESLPGNLEPKQRQSADVAKSGMMNKYFGGRQ